MIALVAISSLLQIFSAWLSFGFVRRKRLGPHWVLVAMALGAMAVLDLRVVALSISGASDLSGDGLLPWVEFLVSALFASGFLLTDRWFRLKERLEGRFRLIARVDRALIGVLEEERVRSVVSEGLTQEGGYAMVFLAAARPDGSVRVLSASGAGSERLAALPFRWDEAPSGKWPVGEALRTGSACVANEPGDPRYPGWAEAADVLGAGSAVAIPLDVRGGDPLALVLLRRERNAVDDLEMEAVRALAHRVGTALVSARRHHLFVSSKRGYDDLLRTQRDGAILVRQGRIVRVNPAGARILGYSPSELVGTDPSMLLPPMGRSSPLSRFLRGDDGIPESGPLEGEFLRKDGALFPGEVFGAWVSRPDESEGYEPRLRGPLGLLFLRDITERMRILEDLRTERDFSARILDTAGILVFRYGAGGEFLLLNRQVEEATGYAARELVGGSPERFLLPASSVPIHLRALRSALRGGTGSNVEFPLRTRSGEEKIFTWSYAPLPVAGGEGPSVVAFGTDVTEIRRLETQVIQMQKLEAIGTLAGGIAHDFNNLLTGILGNLDLARVQLPPGSPAERAIRESSQASDRAAQLVRQLLEFSRRSPIERKPVDLGETAREAVRLFSQTIDRRIRVESEIRPDLWPAKADSGQVHQVVMNLLVNARDAIMECLEGDKAGGGRQGGYSVRVRAGNVTTTEEYRRRFSYARQGDFVALSITDNGSGMDESAQRHIFEPFFTTKTLGRGTGLGLSTVYGIVKQHGGWINMESVPGQGTTFYVYFPRAEEGTSEPARPEEERAAAGPGTGGGTILLVDDEEMIRDYARRVLEHYGYSVITAGDGEEALDLYVRNRDRLDLVILDLSMPHLTGTEVLDRIRAVDPRAKVILSSGYPTGTGFDTPGSARADAVLPKPYRSETLARLVREVLERGAG